MWRKLVHGGSLAGQSIAESIGWFRIRTFSEHHKQMCNIRGGRVVDTAWYISGTIAKNLVSRVTDSAIASEHVLF